jgi:predicted DsbA family dithiol-disulfide isomerase
MDDLLFRNQEARRPVEELAREAGLDLPRFRDCLGSAATSQRLVEDVAAGLRDKVPATPTFVVGGTLSVGRIPVELLPSPSPSAAK